MQELIDACRYEDEDKAKGILAAGGVSQETLDRALYEAAYCPLLSLVEPLLEAGANPNQIYATTRSERAAKTTALTALLAYAGDEEGLLSAVHLLLSKGADPNLRDVERNGRTALMVACNHHLVDAARLLLESGADPTVLQGKPGREEAALYKVFTRGNDHLAMTKLTRLLLDAGARADEPSSSWKRSPLMMACSSGATDAARMLIDAGAIVDRLDTNGASAYALASDKGHREVCALLIERHATATAAELLRAELVASHRSEDWATICRIGKEALTSLEPEAWLYQTISTAHEKQGELETAIEVAQRGLRDAFEDVLLTRLVTCLCRCGRHAESLDAWNSYKSRLCVGATDRHLLANLLVSYDELGRRREGLDELAPFIEGELASGSSQDGGLLSFNLACLCCKEGELPLALKHMESSMNSGFPLESFENDSDLRGLRAHPAYSLVAHKAVRAQTWIERDGSALSEVVLRHRELIVRSYAKPPFEAADDVNCEEFDTDTEGALAFVARCEELRSEGWRACVTPAIDYWALCIGKVFERWCKSQEAEGLQRLGAVIVEWDFGDTPSERNLWIAGYGEAPEGTYDEYVYGDGTLVDAAYSGPPIDTPEVFEAIVAKAYKTASFAALSKSAPFHFVFQEHDAGHECTVRWP